MIDLSSYPWTEFEARRAVTDAMWEFSTTINSTVSYPPFHRAVSLSRIDGDTTDIIMAGCPVTRDIDNTGDEQNTEITLYSYAQYLDKPIRPEERAANITVDENDIITDTENPAELVRRWLFEEDGTTPRCGMYLGYIQDVPNWSKDNEAGIPWKQYVFDTQTIRAAIDEICSDTGMIFYDYWEEIGGVLKPTCYFVHEDSIDDLLPIPDPLDIVYGGNDEDIAGEPGLIDRTSAEEAYNAVQCELVRTGSPEKWFESYIELDEVCADVPARVLPYTNADLIPTDATDEEAQAICDAKAEGLLDFVQISNQSYEVVFNNRTDIRPYQKIRFSGGFSFVPENTWMRVTEVIVSWRDATDIKTTITIAPEQRWSLLRKYARLVGQDYQKYYEGIKKGIYAEIYQAELVTITGFDGEFAIGRLDRGDQYIKGIHWNY